MNQYERSLVQKVKAVLTPDLLKPNYRRLVEAGANPMTGHCYVATEALWHLLGGSRSPYKTMVIRHEGGTHWFLLGDDGTIIDATKEQFRTPVPYELARGNGFMTTTPKPSARARTVIQRVKKASR